MFRKIIFRKIIFRKLIINLFGKLEQRDVVVVLEVLLVILVDDRVHREADILPGEIGGDDDHEGEDYDDHSHVSLPLT